MTEEQRLKFDILRTPSGFAALILEMKMYDWQRDVLAWFINQYERTLAALCTPNGAGKSSGVVAVLALWWVWIYPKGRVVITTMDSKQMDEQIYPALERHRGRFPGWKWVTSPWIQITTERGGKINAFTTNDPGRAEGWHKFDDDSGPLLIIIDEAKSVDNGIFEAVDRCTYNALLYVSSPGEMEGQFYDAFTKHKALFKTRKVTLLECPHIPRAKIDMMRMKYGEDSPLYRSSIMGEFMEQGDIPYVFPRRELRRALDNPPRRQPGSVTLFCDFAGGGDENALGKREGNELNLVDSWREKDTTLAIMRFINHFRQLKVPQERIFGDNGGLGKAMIDSMWRAGWEINRIDNQTRPADQNYVNRGAEMWHETAGACRRNEVVFEAGTAGDPEVFEQLVSRRAVWNAIGRLGVEEKKKMKDRGLPSPDKGDALCGACFCHSLIPEKQTSAFDEQWEEFETTQGIWLPAGANAGQ